MDVLLRTRVLFVSLILFLLSSLTVSHTSMYVFYPTHVSLVPQPPPLLFNGSSNLFVCVDFLRLSRDSLVFSDFEFLPPGWGRLGGSWSVSSGFKGGGLLGVDDDGGPGGSSVYYWGSSISSYGSLSISVKVLRQSGNAMWMGVSLLQQISVSSRLYEIDIYVSGTTGRLEIWYYSGSSWTRLYRSRVFSLADSNAWFILYVNYSRNQATSTNEVSVAAYSVGGSILASGTVSIGGNRYFIPSYVGVSVDGGQARFDDFVVSVTDPRYVRVTGLPQDFTIELYDDLGNKVAEASSSGSLTYLNVLSDAVVGRGLGGVFKIYDPEGNTCLVKDLSSSESVVGSDTYVLVAHEILITLYDDNTRAELRVLFSSYSTQLTKTPVLNVLLADSSPYYLGIIFYPEHSVAQPDLKLLIETSNETSSTSILVDGSSLPSEPVESGFIKIAQDTRVVLSIEVIKGGTDPSEISLELVYCVDPQLRGVCVYYPITLEV